MLTGQDLLLSAGFLHCHFISDVVQLVGTMKLDDSLYVVLIIAAITVFVIWNQSPRME